MGLETDIVREHMWDFSIYVIGGLFALAMGVIGGFVSSTKRWHRWFFVACGALNLCVIVAAGFRSWIVQETADLEKRDLNRKIDVLRTKLEELAIVPRSLGEIRTLVEKGRPERVRDEEADLEFQFYGKDSLGFRLHNRSHSVTARDPKYWFGIWNCNRANPSEDPRVNDPLPVPVRLEVGEFIQPRKAATKELLRTPALRARVKDGDKLFGFAPC